MGAPVRGARPPSHVAYYVALAGIAALLVMLCCYLIYFFVTKIHELSGHESLMQAPASRPPAYPVQPVVRDSATAMAKLCKLPDAPGPAATPAAVSAAPAGKGDTVFPAHSSPEAQRTDTGEGAPRTADAPGKAPAPPVAPNAGGAGVNPALTVR